MKKHNSDTKNLNHSKSEKEEKVNNDKPNHFLEKSKSHGRHKAKYSPLSNLYFEELPTLAETDHNNIEIVLKEKLYLSSIVFDFSNYERLEEKDRKEKTLMEISEYIQQLHGQIGEYIYSDLCHMVGCNIFRTLAPFHPVVSVGIEDEDDFQLNESWPHLQYIYEIMLRLLEHPDFDSKKAKQYIDHTFVKYFLELFDSADPRERDYLKTILHRIYGKMINLRAFIRKHINNIFFTFIYETERHNGIAELLEILGSVINGFQIPLKEEHRTFLKHVLLPLHKAKCLNQYHPQLAYCITEFIKKDRTLISDILVDGLIKFWPKMHSFKELMFLNELEECLELCDKKQFQKILRPLFIQLAKCVSSTNFQVCERTLYLWTNVDIVELMTENIADILPLVFPAMYNSKQHWNKQIHAMVFNALKVMMDMNPNAFDDYTSQFKERRNKEKQQIDNQNELWNKLYMKAKKNPMFKKYSNSIISYSSVNSFKEDTHKNLTGIGAEIQHHLADSEAIVKKQAVPKLPATISLKSTDIKTNSKESYSFKN